MQLDVNLSINKKIVDNPMEFNEKNIASGWVEVEGAVKFPVQVLKNRDNKMFVRFPAKQNKDGNYTNIVFPIDKNVKAEIEEEVIGQVHKEINKALNHPDITDIRVSVSEDKDVSGSVKIRGIASVKMCGIVINGFMIKETEKGFFVQMPQYRDEHGQYHDTFYATNKVTKVDLTNSILEAYENKLKEMQVKRIETEKTQKLNVKSPKV